jgi:hypothetical protein
MDYACLYTRLRAAESQISSGYTSSGLRKLLDDAATAVLQVSVLTDAISTCRAQWIHSVNAEKCLKALGEVSEP